VSKRPDGIVIIDPAKAKGQRQLVDACPYRAIWWNAEKALPQAWPFDAHLLDAGWTKTRGAQVCSTQALRVLHVEDDEMERIVRGEGLQVLHPEYGTRPRVYYKNLDRYYKAFVGGTLAGEIDGVEECVEGARVVFKRGAQTLAETASDAYGDFKFDGLEEGSGRYQVEIADERFAPKSVGVELGRSTYLGTIPLARRSAVPA
jgi:nitrate reductase beta subunit